MEKWAEEIVSDMLAIMPENKWIKDGLSDEDGMCMLGAYCKVMYGDAHASAIAYTGDPFTCKMADVIKAQFSDRIGLPERSTTAIWRFNDHEDTTYDDVRLVLEKVRAG